MIMSVDSTRRPGLLIPNLGTKIGVISIIIVIIINVTIISSLSSFCLSERVCYITRLRQGFGFRVAM